MMYNFWGSFGPDYAAKMMSSAYAGLLGTLLVPLALWSTFWMGWALWKAAKADSKPWFIVLLLVHTVGILDILYIFVFSKAKKGKKRK